MKANISRQELERFELEHKERDDLNKIKEDIKKHHEIFSKNLLNMNLSTAKNIIKKAFINLREDENNLRNFIKEIKQKIEKKTKDRNLSIGNFACNAGHLIYRGFQSLRGGPPLLILNLFICLASTGVSFCDIVIQQNHIDLYKTILFSIVQIMSSYGQVIGFNLGSFYFKEKWKLSLFYILIVMYIIAFCFVFVPGSYFRRSFISYEDNKDNKGKTESNIEKLIIY